MSQDELDSHRRELLAFLGTPTEPHIDGDASAEIGAAAQKTSTAQRKLQPLTKEAKAKATTHSPTLPARDSQVPSAPVRAWFYSMSGQCQSTVDRYCELANAKEESLKRVATPCMDDHVFSAEDNVEKKGHYHPAPHK